MARLKWHIDGTSPLYIQLADSLRREIISGACGPGCRIASVRELAADAKVNPNTMQRALFELEREGLIETRGTTGKYVTEDGGILARTRREVLDSVADDLIARLSSFGCGADEISRLIADAAARHAGGMGNREKAFETEKKE